jgi:hypothetical protein
LKRLIAQKIWIRDARKATLSEIDAQLSELKRLLAQLQSDVQDQLKKGNDDLGRVETGSMKERSSEDVAKALDLADQEIDKLGDQSAKRGRTANAEAAAPQGAEGVQRYSRSFSKIKKLSP